MKKINITYRAYPALAGRAIHYKSSLVPRCGLFAAIPYASPNFL